MKQYTYFKVPTRYIKEYLSIVFKNYSYDLYYALTKSFKLAEEQATYLKSELNNK